MGEILSQDVEFISDFMGLLTITPGSHPKTYRVLHIASLIGSFIALHFKGSKVDGYERVRPSQLCPALLPPVPVPGHASFPSGHSTQAHLMAGCIGYLLDQAALPQPDRDALTIDLGVLADRVARNREIAGLHYESDSKGGAALAASVLATLTNNNAAVPAGVVAMFDDAITEAIGEWP
jgi:membrane-associated phospholipid phosphatase